MRTFLAALVAAVVLSLAACGGGTSPAPDHGAITPPPSDNTDGTPDGDVNTPPNGEDTPIAPPAVDVRDGIRQTPSLDTTSVTISWSMVAMFQAYRITRDVVKTDDMDETFTVDAAPFVDMLPSMDLLVEEIHYTVSGVTDDGEDGPGSMVVVPADFSWLTEHDDFMVSATHSRDPPSPISCEVVDDRLHCDRLFTGHMPLDYEGLTFAPPIGFDVITVDGAHVIVRRAL